MIILRQIFASGLLQLGTKDLNRYDDSGVCSWWVGVWSLLLHLCANLEATGL